MLNVTPIFYYSGFFNHTTEILQFIVFVNIPSDGKLMKNDSAINSNYWL